MFSVATPVFSQVMDDNPKASVSIIHVRIENKRQYLYNKKHITAAIGSDAVRAGPNISASKPTTPAAQCVNLNECNDFFPTSALGICRKLLQFRMRKLAKISSGRAFSNLSCNATPSYEMLD